MGKYRPEPRNGIGNSSKASHCMMSLGRKARHNHDGRLEPQRHLKQQCKPADVKPTTSEVAAGGRGPQGTRTHEHPRGSMHRRDHCSVPRCRLLLMHAKFAILLQIIDFLTGAMLWTCTSCRRLWCHCRARRQMTLRCRSSGGRRPANPPCPDKLRKAPTT